MFCHEVFFRVYLALALDVYNRLFIDCLGFIAVDQIKKHIMGLTQSNILTLVLISALTLRVWGRMTAAVSIFDFVHQYWFSLLKYINNISFMQLPIKCLNVQTHITSMQRYKCAEYAEICTTPEILY